MNFFWDCRQGKQVSVYTFSKLAKYITVLAQNLNSGNNNLDPLSECLQIQHFPGGILSEPSGNLLELRG
jgi:hypothetical protein